MKDGGPAFPSVGEGFGNPQYSAPGMTLRDYFAAAALIGLVQRNDIEDAPIAAMKAYVVADAMLAAREQEEDA